MFTACERPNTQRRAQWAFHFLPLLNKNMASGWFQKNVSLVLSGPPRMECDDDGKVYVCVCLTWLYCNIVLSHTKGRREPDPNTLSQAFKCKLFIPLQATGEALGRCRWTHRVTLSIALPLYCSGEHCNGKSLYKQQHSAGRFHFL